MGQILTGVGIILFGLAIGGVGVATAGIGIGIPMLPLGAYLAYRGGRTLYLRKRVADVPTFERTQLGAILFGILLVLIGAATSAMLVGIPTILAGVALILYSVWPRRG